MGGNREGIGSSPVLHACWSKFKVCAFFLKKWLRSAGVSVCGVSRVGLYMFVCLYVFLCLPVCVHVCICISICVFV